MMNPLNLNRLNILSPYTVWQSSVHDYGFKTEYGVLYRINFVQDKTIWEDGAFEFSILNENQRNSPNDKKVRDTIFAIIGEFFECNPDILLYQCETGDNRQDQRDRLFLRWFNEYALSSQYYIKVSSLKVEEQMNYAAIIVQRSNPELERIIKDFDNFIGFFSQKPR